MIRTFFLLLFISAGVLAAPHALAGSSYTPPSSGGGVSGDGTGVTDASAFRTALSLGTAATVNTGTSNGNAVVLGMGGSLPAVDGSNLTGLLSSQISGLGTAASASSGDFVAASSFYATESWTNRWKTADGDPTSNGWTQGGSVNMTIASTTQGGVSCYSLTPNGSSGSSYIQATWTAASSSYELYFKVWLPASTLGASTKRMSISYSPDATASGSKRIELGLSAVGFALFDGTNLTSRATIPDATGQWADILIQVTQSTNGAANTWLRVFIGRVLVYNALAPTLGATAGAGAGTVYIGRINAGTQTDVFYIADMAMRTAWNEAPADYRFRSAAWPL